MWTGQSGCISWGFGESFGSPWCRWSVPRPAPPPCPHPSPQPCPTLRMYGCEQLEKQPVFFRRVRWDFRTWGVAGLAVVWGDSGCCGVPKSLCHCPAAGQGDSTREQWEAAGVDVQPWGPVTAGCGCWNRDGCWSWNRHGGSWTGMLSPHITPRSLGPNECSVQPLKGSFPGSL